LKLRNIPIVDLLKPFVFDIAWQPMGEGVNFWKISEDITDTLIGMTSK
jgi:hypothetical protein